MLHLCVRTFNPIRTSRIYMFPMQCSVFLLRGSRLCAEHINRWWSTVIIRMWPQCNTLGRAVDRICLNVPQWYVLVSQPENRTLIFAWEIIDAVVSVRAARVSVDHSFRISSCPSAPANIFFSVMICSQCGCCRLPLSWSSFLPITCHVIVWCLSVSWRHSWPH